MKTIDKLTKEEMKIIEGIDALAGQTCNEYISITEETRKGAKLAYPKTWHKFCALGSVYFAVANCIGLGDFDTEDECRHAVHGMVDIAFSNVDYDEMRQQL